MPLNAALLALLPLTAGLTEFAVAASDEPLRIVALTRPGEVSWSQAPTSGVVAIQSAPRANGPWTPGRTFFSTNGTGLAQVSFAASAGFYRLWSVELPPTLAGFTNLTLAYGLLETIAGAGGPPNTNNWRPEFEGGPAANAVLSGPHIAIADRWGQIYIAEKDSHGIRKVRPDGTIVTAAGINLAGNGPDGVTNATQCALNGANGLWVNSDGTVFILDSGNNKVRRRDTNGTIRTLFTVSPPDLIDRGIWVSEDETVAYLATHPSVLKWVKNVGVTTFSTGYQSLGNLVVDPWGNLVVTDRYGNRVYRLDSHGNKTAIAGNGTKSGGGDGQLALNTGLEEVRGVWFLPTGAYFLCNHKGSQVWYVDTAGYNHLFLNGSSKDDHAGDGTWFYIPNQYCVSKCRAVTMDYQGNLLITENDYGYVHWVRF